MLTFWKWTLGIVLASGIIGIPLLRYRMIYFNMGHDDMDYGQRPPRAVSSSFASPEQNRMVVNALEWLGGLSSGLSGVKSRHSTIGPGKEPGGA